MSKKILLVGCGQIGSRHLQAIATLDDISEIHVVDEKDDSMNLSRTRLQQVPDLNRRIKICWHNDFGKESANGDLCIVATQAKERCALVKKIVREYGYKKFLLEKIVSQSTKEYADLLSFARECGLSIWVNCQTRTFGVHKYIKSRLNPDEPIILTDVGGNFGLACNGIHYADLFLYYTGAGRIQKAAERIDPVLHPSKRGADIFDLSGTLHGTTDSGSDFILSYSAQHQNADIVTITSPRGRFIFDYIAPFAYECPAGGGWKEIAVRENFFVSQTSKTIASDILKKNTCELSTLQDCFPAHQYILETLLPHFNKLLGKQNNYCPVT